MREYAYKGVGGERKYSSIALDVIEIPVVLGMSLHQWIIVHNK